MAKQPRPKVLYFYIRIYLVFMDYKIKDLEAIIKCIKVSTHHIVENDPSTTPVDCYSYCFIIGAIYIFGNELDRNTTGVQ